MKPGQVVRRARASHLIGVMPDLEAEIENMKAKIEAQAMLKLRDGTLSPEIALQFWTEVQAANTLLRTLKTRISLEGAPDPLDGRQSTT